MTKIILIFEDRFTDTYFKEIQRTVESSIDTIQLKNFRSWNYFFTEFDANLINWNNVAGIFLDHVLEDNDHFDRDNLAEDGDGFSSYSFVTWLKINNLISHLDFVYGISSTPQKQLEFIPHVEKNTVLDSAKLIEFLGNNLS